ncbi:MAG TPA: hypothetical protein VIH81_08205 [Roseiarcus sp.]|jgi:uncharacterized integral membrane protein
MIRFLRVVFFALVALILLGFAFANRHDVIVSFDPFAAIDNAALSIAAPLFAVVIVAAMLGIVAGAFATWLSQGHHRRAARQNRIEADKWRAQAEALKTARARETSHPALPGNS